MAYSELIKNFNRTRAYMREFYVYGFKSRGEFTGKSARSYDNERRRVESWLGDYMRFRQTPEGKNIFISIDSRVSHRNPLYAAWKAKSFTDGDITLHFILFDILYSPEISLSLNEISERIDEYLASFDTPRVFDTSTVRKKLNEYLSEGIIAAEKRGKTLYYRRTEPAGFAGTDVLDFFSETAPCGVIGSYLLDRQPGDADCFAFKHHYITAAMDSEILCTLFEAMSEKRSVALETVNRRGKKLSESGLIPLRIMVSVQNGRQYLMAFSPRFSRIVPFRADYIISVKSGKYDERFDTLRKKLDDMATHMWGVSTHGDAGEHTERVEFTVKYSDGEAHIHHRLEREKRCGTVERLDKNTSRFSADVYDSRELIPWIRTFICRITDIHFSDSETESQFKSDIKEMYALYGIADEEGGNDFQ